MNRRNTVPLPTPAAAAMSSMETASVLRRRSACKGGWCRLVVDGVTRFAGNHSSPAFWWPSPPSTLAQREITDWSGYPYDDPEHDGRDFDMADNKVLVLL